MHVWSGHNDYSYLHIVDFASCYSTFPSTSTVLSSHFPSLFSLRCPLFYYSPFLFSSILMSLSSSLLSSPPLPLVSALWLVYPLQQWSFSPSSSPYASSATSLLHPNRGLLTTASPSERQVGVFFYNHIPLRSICNIGINCIAIKRVLLKFFQFR